MLIPCSRSVLVNLWYACPKWHTERLPWRTALTAVPIFFLLLLPSQNVYIVKCLYACAYKHVSDCVEIVFEILLLPNSTVSETFLPKSGVVRSVDWIYHWGTGLAVTGRICDIGRNVSQSSFQTGSSTSPSYFHIFFLIAFLNETCVRKIIIIV